jgi:hypothetical protein
MTCGEGIGTRPRRANRSAVARSRLEAARGALADCQLCAHRCRVDRLAGERGSCQAGADARVFIAQVEVSDELELIPADEQIQPRTAPAETRRTTQAPGSRQPRQLCI